jgi:hypothetical protein
MHSRRARALDPSEIDPAHIWERCVPKVRKTDSCWVWVASKVNGYGQIQLPVGGRPRQLRAHRLSWALANGVLKADLQVRHKCDNPSCVNPKHLETGTNQQNVDDRVIRGRQPRGEDVGGSKLTSSDVVDAWYQAKNGRSQSSIARCLGVTQGTVSSMLSGRNWSHG